MVEEELVYSGLIEMQELDRGELKMLEIILPFLYPELKANPQMHLNIRSFRLENKILI